jgi:hypothetical protein
MHEAILSFEGIYLEGIVEREEVERVVTLTMNIVVKLSYA